MGKLWCSLWSRLLGAFTDIVDVVIDAVKSVGELVVDLLVYAADAVGSSPFGFILLGVSLFFLLPLLTGSGDEKKTRARRDTEGPDDLVQPKAATRSTVKLPIENMDAGLNTGVVRNYTAWSA